MSCFKTMHLIVIPGVVTIVFEIQITLCFLFIYRLPETIAVYGPLFIKATMSSQRFDEIRQFLRFNYNNFKVLKDDQQHDRLHKVHPFIKNLRINFAQVFFEESLFVDKQICATKAGEKCSLRSC